MMTTPRPKPHCPIEFTFDRVLCSTHGEPFRAKWPAGYPIFTVLAFDTIMQDPRFCQECGDKTENIQRALDLLPLCCRLRVNSLLQIYHAIHDECKVFTEDKCSYCSRFRLGSPCEYKLRLETKKLNHLCFDCLLFRIEEVRDHIRRRG